MAWQSSVTAAQQQVCTFKCPQTTQVTRIPINLLLLQKESPRKTFKLNILSPHQTK